MGDFGGQLSLGDGTLVAVPACFGEQCRELGPASLKGRRELCRRVVEGERTVGLLEP